MVADLPREMAGELMAHLQYTLFKSEICAMVGEGFPPLKALCKPSAVGRRWLGQGCESSSGKGKPEPGLRLCHTGHLTEENTRHLLKKLIIFVPIANSHPPFVPKFPLSVARLQSQCRAVTLREEKTWGQGHCGHD